MEPLECTKRLFRVDREEIHYFRFLLESYDGMALVSTKDPNAALIEVRIAPGCEAMVLELMDALRNNENLSISAPL